MNRARWGVPVLMYHHISPVPGPHTVSPERFREQLRWLKDAGYRLLSGEEFRRFHSGELELQERSALITFDDGWLDNWRYAIPILDEEVASAVLFVVSSWPGDGPARHQLRYSPDGVPVHGDAMELAAAPGQRDSVVMRWSELLHARQNGTIELQCHSHSHGEWWQARSGAEEMMRRLESDLDTARWTLKERTGEAPTQLCWPKGQFSLSMRDLASRKGFTTQYTTLRGTNLGRDQNRRTIRRLHVEDKPLDWFASRVKLYSRPWVANMLGRAHQALQGRRMARQYGDLLGRQEFGMSPWRQL